jgi:hypothetical protein
MKMKKITQSKKHIYALLVCIGMLLFCACAADKPSEEVLATTERFFTYPLEETSLFTVDEEGTVYILNEQTLEAFDLDGVCTGTYTFPNEVLILNMCYEGRKIYINYIEQTSSQYKIASFDLDTQDLQEITDYTDMKMTRMMKIAVLDGSLYVLGILPSYQLLPSTPSPYDADWYEYPGSVLLSCSVEGGELEVVFENEIENFSIDPSGTLVVYAHDSEGGYYFAKLEEGVNGAFTKIYRSEVTYLTSFCATDEGIVYRAGISDFSRGMYNLSFTKLEQDSATTDVMPNVILQGNDSIYTVKGYTFYHNGLYSRLERIQNAAYIKDAPTISMISCLSLGADMFSGGYSVHNEEKSVEEFTLSVLSNESTYDACYLSSSQDISHNLRDKGSFYPLNDVPGVMEYLDSCFPYIKEAAMDEDGNVWMIPVTLDVMVLTTQQQNCEAEGIPLREAKTIYDIVDIMEDLNKRYPDGSMNYAFHNYRFGTEALRRYFHEQDTADTDSFRKLAPVLKEVMQMQSPLLGGDSLAEYTFGTLPNFLFTTQTDRSGQTRPFLVELNDLVSVPILGQETPYLATCIFVCVNPNSKNLDATLSYITALSSYTMNLSNSGLSADSSHYTDSAYMDSLYEIYQNGTISFELPYEVYNEDFARYVAGEMELEDMIEEVDRKLAIYLGE